jgi:hypothetical protein
VSREGLETASRDQDQLLPPCASAEKPPSYIQPENQKGKNGSFSAACKARRYNERFSLKRSTTKAILTDAHFWIPLTVLVLGVLLLIYVH